jgi:hypothetical protein
VIEIWKDIINYPNYEVSNLGNVRNKKTNKILKPFSTGNEYLKVSLNKNGKPKQFFIHRLVAQTFIPNPNNLKEVNHIKEFEKTNNNVENLEWCDHSYNQNYGTRNERVSKKMSRVKCKKVNQYDLEGNYIKTWDSIKEAEKETGSRHISQCAKGKFKQTKGYRGEYKYE